MAGDVFFYTLICIQINYTCCPNSIFQSFTNFIFAGC